MCHDMKLPLGIIQECFPCPKNSLCFQKGLLLILEMSFQGEFLAFSSLPNPCGYGHGPLGIEPRHHRRAVSTGTHVQYFTYSGSSLPKAQTKRGLITQRQPALEESPVDGQKLAEKEEAGDQGSSPCCWQ